MELHLTFINIDQIIIFDLDDSKYDGSNHFIIEISQNTDDNFTDVDL